MRNTRTPPLDSRLCLRANFQQTERAVVSHAYRNVSLLATTSNGYDISNSLSIVATVPVFHLFIHSRSTDQEDEYRLDRENIGLTFSPDRARAFDVPHSGFIRWYLGAIVARLPIALRQGVASSTSWHNTGINGQPIINELTQL